MLSCFGSKAILRCPGIPGSERLEDYGGWEPPSTRGYCTDLETVSLASVYTACPGNKDVPATPCRKRQLRRLPVSCATIGLLIELSRREDYELLPNMWNQLARRESDLHCMWS